MVIFVSLDRTSGLWLVEGTWRELIHYTSDAFGHTFGEWRRDLVADCFAQDPSQSVRLEFLSERV